MEENYSIEEILSAVNEIQNKKKEKKNESFKNKLFQSIRSNAKYITIRIVLC